MSMKTREEGRVPIKSEVTFADIGGYEKSREVGCNDNLRKIKFNVLIIFIGFTQIDLGHETATSVREV
jgi:hypothetical protein